jgi:hypothetical protein
LSCTQASRYAELFGLNETEAKELTEYLGHWDKLRVCCGTQMSASYRAFLHKSDEHHKMKGGVISNTSKVPTTPMEREQATASLAGRGSTQMVHVVCMRVVGTKMRHRVAILQMCQSLDLDQVESAMMATSLFQYGKHIRVVSHPTMREEAFTGTYCTRANAAIAQHKLKFNARLQKYLRDKDSDKD